MNTTNTPALSGPSGSRLLNGTDFGPIWGMSGVTNFFGQGWPHHKILRKWGLLNFDGMTFVAKTTTLCGRPGNMPLGGDLMPTEHFPRCINVGLSGFLSARILNAVSLSGPGLLALLSDGRWQQQTEPFMISYMSVESDREARMTEMKSFVCTLLNWQKNFHSPFGVQLNESCPNTAHGKASIEEIRERLEWAAALHKQGIAIIVKFGLDTPPETALKITDHPGCDGICIPNTIPFGATGFDIPWNEWYPHGSPIAQHFGDKFKGGLSGEPLREHALRWIRKIRALGYTKHINAGGGLLKPRHVDHFDAAGADSVAIGCAAIVRPWRVQRIIRRAHSVFR